MTFHKLYPLSNSLASQKGRLSLPGTESIYLTGDGEDSYCCWNCGDILMKNISNLKISNLALLCKKCEVYNDANRIWKNTNLPPYLSLLPESVNNSIHILTYSFWTNSPLKNELIPLSDKLYDRWIDVHEKVPSVLQHYTSFAGLNGIINTSSLWLTDAAFMNDASELSYGKDLINTYLTDKSLSVSDPCKELLRRGLIKQDVLTTSKSYFITCFCTNGDLLSQWRAYGGGGNGYSIGFSTKDFQLDPSLQLRKVVYERTSQVSFIKETVDSVCDLFSRISDGHTIKELEDSNTLPYFVAFLENHLLEYLFTFKHKSFEEENEWRLISQFSIDKDIERIKFRSHNGMPVPYIDQDLRLILKKINQIPMVSITHGPTLLPSLTMKALVLLLEKFGYTFTEIYGSETPLRL